MKTLKTICKISLLLISSSAFASEEKIEQVAQSFVSALNEERLEHAASLVDEAYKRELWQYVMRIAQREPWNPEHSLVLYQINGEDRDSNIIHGVDDSQLQYLSKNQILAMLIKQDGLNPYGTIQSNFKVISVTHGPKYGLALVSYEDGLASSEMTLVLKEKNEKWFIVDPFNLIKTLSYEERKRK